MDKKLQKAVEGFREKAVALYRMSKINKLMQYKVNVAKKADGLKKDLVDYEKSLEVLVYDETKLDTKHPNYAQDKKYADEAIADQEKIVANFKKAIAETEKEIADKTKEYDEKITGWENGTRKGDNMEEEITEMAEQLMRNS